MRTVLVVVGTALLFACGNSNEEKQKKFEKEVMAVHDSIMSKMDKLQANKRALGKLKRSWKIDTLKVQQLEMIEDQIGHLDSAHKAMMQWMRSYQKPADSLSHEETMTYLEDKKNQIEAVGDLMVGAIHRSDSLLLKYQSK